MPESASVLQRTQIGIEAQGTPGTVVPAIYRLHATSLGVFAPTAEMQPFTAAGQKYPQMLEYNREWATASLGGEPSYEDIIFPLGGVLGRPAYSLVGGVRTYVFTPSAIAADSLPTYTIEQANAVWTQRIAYAYFNALELTFSRRNGVTISGGEVIGQAITDGVTMTATPTELPLRPILPKEVDIYMNASSGTLGTTKLTRALSAVWGISNRRAQLWALNSAVSGYAADYEVLPGTTFTTTLANDATSRALIATWRASTAKFFRLKATGPTLGSGNYTLQIDLAAKINAGFNPGDQDGLSTVEVPWTIVYDPTWTNAMIVTLQNNRTDIFA